MELIKEVFFWTGAISWTGFLLILLLWTVGVLSVEKISEEEPEDGSNR